MPPKARDEPGKTPALRTYTIYRDPLDAPGRYVVRGFSIYRGEPDPVPDAKAYAVDTLAQARALVPGGLVRFARSATDDAAIVETWL